MFKLEIDTSSETFDPDFGYELARMLDNIRRCVNGLQAGFGSIGGRIATALVPLWAAGKRLIFGEISDRRLSDKEFRSAVSEAQQKKAPLAGALRA